MNIAHFQAYYKAMGLSNYTFGYKKFIPVFASSDIEIFPYQIAAAQFVMRSPYLKGAILCDEGSLGKTYEAMLVINQTWYESKKNILIIVPTSLLSQWKDVVENRFSIPFFVIDNNKIFNEIANNRNENPFNQDGIILTTYNFAQEKHEYIKQINWDLSVFEEAHHLRKFYTDKTKSTMLIHESVAGSFKLLLTATPIQNSIMDLYGLIYFIDEKVLPDVDTFYQRYFRKPENYPELAQYVSRYCFRTTRQQAETYVKIPERIPITVEFELNNQEKEVYNLLENYIQKDKKLAFPQMDKYDLALMLYHTFSSSSFALNKTLEGVIKRLEKMLKKDDSNTKLQNELNDIKQVYKLSKNISENTKGVKLLETLKNGFSKLKSLGAKKKALIFTENKATQKYLYDLLSRKGYKDKVLMFNGDCSRDYSIIENFKDKAEILIATDVASEGLNLEFCSFVINYDLPYNILTIEQRINRCHRQGQESDVIVVNFINKNNFADVRMVELINKRVLQFDGILGLTDNVIGNFDVDFNKAISQARTKKEIDETFNKILKQYEEYNKKLVKVAKHSLFTSFSKDIADKFIVLPQYIESTIEKLNNDLWDITKYFFSQNGRFNIDDKTRTISFLGTPPKVFTGSSLGRNEYSMDKNYKPRSGRHTITGSLAQRIIKQIKLEGIYDKGEIVLDGDFEECNIGYYEIDIKSKKDFLLRENFYTFVGKTLSGRDLTHDECKEIMDLPAVSCTHDGVKIGEMDWWKGEKKLYHKLDDIVSAKPFIEKVMSENSNAEKEEIEQIKQYTNYKKSELQKNINRIEYQLKTFERGLSNVSSLEEKLTLKKNIALLQKEYMKSKQSLFFDEMRLDQELENKIKELTEKAELVSEIKRMFVIKIKKKE